MLKATTFIFDRYTWDPELGIARFYYAFDDGTRFEETLRVPLEPDTEMDSVLLDRVLFSLHLMLGISYWKAAAPKKIDIRSGKLTNKQAEFWNLVYTKGLGEFFYENKIDFRKLVDFPALLESAPKAVSAKTGPRSLVLLGGGKDSLATLGLLEKMNHLYDTFNLGAHPVLSHQVQELKLTNNVIQRTLSPNLFELNAQGAMNGHVPISAVYAFTSLLMATLNGYSYIVASNEQSSNYGNVDYLGWQVNHQWSKSHEFEQLFQTYVREFITPDIVYFSLLRPLHEIHVAKIFSQHTEYWPLFASCNRNFSVRNTAPKRWCGECSKCLFVFVMLAPFISRSALTEIFEKNLLADKTLLSELKRQLGVESFKPFDCVGTPEEVKVALALAHDVGEYDDDPLMKYFVDDVLPEMDLAELTKHVFAVSDDHSIPDDFQGYLHESQE